MCFSGGGGSDNSALLYQQNQDRQARAEEEAREARIAIGRQQIDALFDRGQTLVPGTGTVTAAKTDVSNGFFSPLMIAAFGAPSTTPTTTTPQWQTTQSAFDDKFYDQRRQAYLGNYTPQLEDQYKKAREDLTYALARSNLTRSSVGADKTAELNAAYKTKGAEIATNAEQDVNTYRGNVEDARTNLISQLQATADPAGSANLALARTQVLQKQPVAYDTLGDVFTGIASGIGNFVSGVRQKQLYDKFSNAAGNANSATTSSSTGAVGGNYKLVGN